MTTGVSLLVTLSSAQSCLGEDATTTGLPLVIGVEDTEDSKPKDGRR